jgi:hypothetical protein
MRRPFRRAAILAAYNTRPRQAPNTSRGVFFRLSRLSPPALCMTFYA